MKLSEKGESRLYNSKNVFYDDDIEGDVVALWELSKVWEFEPDDFTGAVVLTVEEAKQLQEDFLGIVCELVRLVGRYGVKYEKPSSLIMLKERIEQTEKCNAND